MLIQNFLFHHVMGEVKVLIQNFLFHRVLGKVKISSSVSSRTGGRSMFYKHLLFYISTGNFGSKLHEHKASFQLMQ